MLLLNIILSLFVWDLRTSAIEWPSTISIGYVWPQGLFETLPQGLATLQLAVDQLKIDGVVPQNVELRSVRITSL